jgi:hypothetical protein
MLEFSKGKIEKEKNVIIMTPTGKEKSYRLDVNTGVLYGLRGSAIVTMPPVLNDAMKIAYSNRYRMEDKVGMLLSNFYDILTHSNLSFNDLNQAGVWLTLDKIINAVGVFHLDHISIMQLEYINKHFTAYVKYMKDDTILPENAAPYKTLRFERWHKEFLIAEKFRLNECSECTRDVVNYLLGSRVATFSDEEMGLGIWFSEHQLSTFFANNAYKVSDWIIGYKQMCNDLGLKMEKGNFMMLYNALKREYDLRKAEIDKAKMQARYATHAKAWEFEDEEYMVVIPTCAEDFITEGRLQHNCVGGYVEAVLNEARGCHVIFLRKKENPEIPVLTVEIDSYNRQPRIRQFLLAYNQHPNRNTQPELYELHDRLENWIRENW